MIERIVVAGLGCRRGCSLAELLQLLQRTLAEYDLQTSDLMALASSTHKRDEPALLQLAEHLQCPLLLLPAEQLTRYHARLSSTSSAALRATGSASVAEASALAQAEVLGDAPAQLLASKRKSAQATVALAVAYKSEFP